MTILLNVFIGIFTATAIIGLLSLPDWIKIPEWYRKRIFILLFVEVISAIIFLFYETYNTNNILNNATVEPVNINWVSNVSQANQSSPKVKIIARDSTYIKEFKVNYTPDGLLEGKISNKAALDIYSSNNHLLGSIESGTLTQNGLFNDLKSINSEIDGKANYRYIKWTGKNGVWKRDYDFLGPFEFKVFEENGGTYYHILDTITNTTLFQGKKENDKSDQLPNNYISEKDRINHFLEYGNNFYLFRITWANLDENNGDKYVNVLNLKIEPTLRSK